MNETQQMGLTVIQHNGDLAAASNAAESKATIEAKFAIAVHRPRNEMTARNKILQACDRPAFAESAIYRKPCGKDKDGKMQYAVGPSIRFAETALQAYGNVDINTTVVWEDELRRTIRVTVTDLENNITFSGGITFSKTVERRFLKDGQDPISERLNSRGDKVYLLPATDDELAIKQAAATSKAVRTLGLRLIPADIIEDASERISQTREKGGKDPKEIIKKICDGFAGIGVSPDELVKYIGHPLESVSPAELKELREIYTTIKDGEASWKDYTSTTEKPEQPFAGFNKSKKKEPEPTQEPTPAPAPEPAQSEPPKPSGVQNDLAETLAGHGVSFDGFARWMANTKAVADPDSIGDWSQVPGAICEALMKNSKEMNNIVKNYKD